MPLPVDPSLVATIASTVQGLGNQGGKILERRRQRKWEEKRYEQMRKDNLDDFNLTNEYNHPKNQVARMVEAGLNPALMYGSGAQSSVEQPKKTEMGSLPYDPFEFKGNLPEVLMQAELMRMQKQDLEQKILQSKAQTMKIIADTDYRQLRTKFEREAYNDMLKAVGLSNAETEASIAGKYQNIDESKQRIEESKARIEKIAADTRFTIDENQRQKLLSALERNKIDYETQYIVRKILREEAEQLRTEAQTVNLKSEKRKLEAQAELLENEIEYLNVERVRQWIPFLSRKK